MSRNVLDVQKYADQFDIVHDEIESLVVLCSTAYVMSRPHNRLSGPTADKTALAENLYGREWESLAGVLMPRLVALVGKLYSTFHELTDAIEEQSDQREAA